MPQYDNSFTLGPIHGWLIIHGGKNVTQEVMALFRNLCGGATAPFVYIPTAWPDDAELERRKPTIKSPAIWVHTRDPRLADTEQFVEPLRHVSGVWIDGGRQPKLVDSYLGTAVEQEIKTLLARGGVVGGTSAGATIQGSYLVRGDPGDATNPFGDNKIMMAPGYETGFGLLANSAIDQHVNQGRQAHLAEVLTVHPELLGIGVSENTAFMIHGDVGWVIGESDVIIHDGKKPFYSLKPGQSFNLKTRTRLNDLRTTSNL